MVNIKKTEKPVFDNSWRIDDGAHEAYSSLAYCLESGDRKKGNYCCIQFAPTHFKDKVTEARLEVTVSRTPTELCICRGSFSREGKYISGKVIGARQEDLSLQGFTENIRALLKGCNLSDKDFKKLLKQKGLPDEYNSTMDSILEKMYK